jgi:hypothetical protein
MTSYIIVTKEEGIEYILHSNNQLYWNWCYLSSRCYPLSYKRLGNAKRKLAKVQRLYPQYKLKIRERGERELMRLVED